MAVSGLEMSQNSMRYGWTREEVDAKLHAIMKSIYSAASGAAAEYGTPGNLVNGANIAGFLKVANAMMDQGRFRTRLRTWQWTGWARPPRASTLTVDRTVDGRR